jgi:hypothetical protein
MASATTEINEDELNPRFTLNTVDEPDAILKPIEGYQNKNVVSLEEAVKPIASLFRNMPSYAGLSMAAAKKTKSYLSHDEFASIHLYTMELEPRSLYTILNELLRKKNRKVLKDWFPYLNLILTALFKMPSVHGNVWRGVKANLNHLYEKGECYTWWSFTSCTVSIEVLESDMYLGQTGERTLFSIECFNGKAIKPYSYYQYEDEILLLPGTYLEVIGKLKPAKDMYIIQMKEVVPPYVLLEPPLGFEQIQNIEFILESVYEVNKKNYHIPKLFIIVHDYKEVWKSSDIWQNRFLLYFVCECEVEQMHLGHYPGYAVPHPLLFFQLYGQYMRQFHKPLAAHLCQHHQTNSIHDISFWETFMNSVEKVEYILNRMTQNQSSNRRSQTDTCQLFNILQPLLSSNRL